MPAIFWTTRCVHAAMSDKEIIRHLRPYRSMIRGQKDIQHHRHTRRVGRLRCTPNIVMTMQHRDQLRRQFHIDPTHRETTYSYQNILLDILATLKLGWGTNKPSIRANGCLRTVTTTRDGKTQKCLLTCSGRFVVALTAE